MVFVEISAPRRLHGKSQDHAGCVENLCTPQAMLKASGPHGLCGKQGFPALLPRCRNTCSM
eukprot:364044-Chlamydomonas_euryale.AAC.7